MFQLRKKHAISDETNIEKIEQKSKKNMVLGTILGYIAIIISIASGLTLTPWIISYVGKDDYSSYGIASSLIALFLLDFGLSTTTNIYLSKLRAEGNKEGVEKFLATIFKVYLTLDILFAVIIAALYFLCPVLYKNQYIDNPEEKIKTLQTLLLVVGGFALISFPSTTFTGVISTYEKFGINKLMDILQKALYFGFTILAIKMDWGIVGITIINVTSMFVTIVFKFLYMRLYLNIKLDLRKKIEKSELKSIFTFSAWSLVLAIASRLIFNITPSILGIVSNSVENTFMNVVITIEGYIYTFGAMMSAFFLAKIARSEANRSEKEKVEFLQGLSIKIGKLQLTVIGLIMVGFISIGQEFIELWMGAEYGVVYWCILAICSYNLLYVPQIVFESAMLTEGHVRPLAINAVIKAAINVTLSFILSHYYGAFGASISIMIARYVEFILNNIAYKRYLHISLFKYFRKLYVRGGTTILVALGAGLCGHFFIPITADIDLTRKLFIVGFSVVIIYAAMTLFVTFSKKERLYFIDAFAKILHIKRKQVETKEAPVEEIPSEEKVEEIENKQEENIETKTEEKTSEE